jgi:hypothetical protein
MSAIGKLREAIGKLGERIRPHAEWDLIKVAAVVIPAGVIGLGAWGMRYIAGLTRGLTAAQQHDLLMWYAFVIGALVIVSVLLIVSILRRRPAQQPTRKDDAAVTELSFDIQDVRFYCESKETNPAEHLPGLWPTNNLFLPWGKSKIYIFLKVSLVNRSATPRAPLHWTLTVRAGSFAADAELIPVDNTLSIATRTSPLSLDIAKEAISPKWDELTGEGLATGVPKVAWAAFSLLVDGLFSAAPHNAEFTLTVTDSMGAVHAVVREPQMYFENARIVKETATIVENDTPPAQSISLPPSPPLPQIEHERVFVDVTPRYLLDCFKGATSEQAKSRVSPFINKWMRISGHITDFDDKGGSSIVMLSEYVILGENGQVLMWFDQQWKSRLEIIPYGSMVSIIGMIDKVQQISVTLKECELL